MTFWQFVSSLLFGALSVLLPLSLFLAAAAVLVYLLRRWTDRRR